MAQPIYIHFAPEDESVACAASAYLQEKGINSIPGRADSAPAAPHDAWSIMLLILSQSASESEEVLREVNAAIAADKVLIPFRVENFRPGGEMQDHLRWRYVLDAFSPPVEKHFDELVRMIKPLLHGRSPRMAEGTSLSRTLPSRAAVLRKPAKVSADCQSDVPIQASLNFPHLVLAGYTSSLQCRIENRSGHPLTQLALRVECNGLKQEIDRSISTLSPGERITLTLEIDARSFGQFNLRVNMQWAENETISSYSALHLLRVHEAPAPTDFPEVLEDFSQAIEGTTVTQNERISLPASIGSADELARYKIPDRFELLDLTLDFDVAVESVGRAQALQSLTIPPEFLDQAQAGSVLMLGPADSSAGDPHQDIRLVARPQFVMGRSSEESDFILWFWPRNEVHDTKTRRISKKHVTLVASGSHLLAMNTAAGSLTTYEGQDITAAGLVLQSRGLLNLSGIYLLDVLHIPGTRQAPAISNLVDWKGRAFPITPCAVRGSVRLLPRTAQVLPQHSTWLLSEATFGTSKINPVALDLPGLADIQGRIRYHQCSFWLQSLCDNSAVFLNERLMAPGEIAPLCTGQTVRLGQTSFTVSVSA